jgi:Protein of unknown function (DUF4054)
MAVVTFDYQAWLMRYPEVAVSAPRAQGFFDEATLYLDNSDCSPVRDVGQRSALLGMLVAHLAKIFGPGADGQPASPLVGRISAASEGSVSVTADYIAPSSSLEAWANQTSYGAAWWAATAQYRRFRYAPGRQPVFDRRFAWQ